MSSASTPTGATWSAGAGWAPTPTTYEANDASVGDLDGDGALDLVLKWQPTNAKDNSQSGYTGNTNVDGMELDGTRLWRTATAMPTAPRPAVYTP